MPRKLTPKKYLNALEVIDVKKVGFLEIHSKLYVKNFSDEPINVDASNEVEFQTDEKAGLLAVIDKYAFKGLVKGKPVFDISFHILVYLTTKVKLDQQFLRLFEQNTLKVITYPYARLELQELTAKMGLSPLTLPMWRVPATAKSEFLKPASSRDSSSNGSK